jgi:hypothetical protein
MKMLPHVLWLIGAVFPLAAWGQWGGASIPYQDPTPELLSTQRRELDKAKPPAVVGSVLCSVGVLWIVGRKLVARKGPDA